MNALRRVARRALLAAAVLVALLALTLLLFLLPPVVHALLDLARAPALLGVESATAYALSDALVRDLLFGGTFDATFTAAHQLLFPAGTWTFNPATDRLVQLYPETFWVAAAIGFCAVLVLTAAAGFRAARQRRR